MAPPRLFIQGLSHHVYHRGNNRTGIYVDDGDRTVFLVLLGRALRRGGIDLHGYALMSNHYHALVTSPDPDALPRAMQRLNRGYVRYFNDRHRRTGTLWEGRYRASLITDESYWLTCLRYIERNPIEAGLVDSPAAYRWSSYAAHSGLKRDALLAPHFLYDVLGPTEAARQMEWRRLCGEPVPTDDEANIRAALRSSRTLHRPALAEMASVADNVAT